MALSKDAQAKMLYLWQDENAVEFIETFIKISDKNGDIIPFLLTDEQKQLVNTMQRENIILKSRQIGISSVVVALSIRACIVKDNSTCLLVSHSQDSTATIFDKLKQQYNSLPDFIKPDTITNNRKQLQFVNNSKITCVTAGSKEIGRGDTFSSIVHLSEFAFWKTPEKQLKALSQAISDSCKLIIESTADGFNKFSNTYYQAKNGENSYNPYFFNWINGGTLFESLYKSSVAKFVARQGRELAFDDLTEEEIELLNIGASMGQITWRREKIATDGLDNFHTEYPSSDDEAFMTTGSQIFDSKKIDSCIKALLEDKVTHIPKANIIGLPVILQGHYPKSLKIYSTPKMGERFYIGCDVSEGLGRDSSTALVLDGNGRQVAQFKNNLLKPYQMADIYDALGRYYNKASLTIEKASGGHAVIERMRLDKKYMNMTKYLTFDERNKERWQVGFDTNAKTKSIIINDAREWFEKGMILIRSQEVLEEMKVFVSSATGSMGAISGQHDDLIIALALAIVSIKGYWYPF